MLSDPVAEAFGLIHRHLRVKISAVCTVQCVLTFGLFFSLYFIKLSVGNGFCIRIYPGKLKFILVKISPDPGRLHGKHAKVVKTKLYSRFLLLRIYPDSPVHTSANIPYSDLSSYAVNLPG